MNVLGDGQQALAGQFAARSPEPGARFAGVPFSPGPEFGVPVLDGCVVSFECEVSDIYPFGGHDIVVGRVAWASPAGEAGPVIHYDGRLRELREAGG